MTAVSPYTLESAAYKHAVAWALWAGWSQSRAYAFGEWLCTLPASEQRYVYGVAMRDQRDRYASSGERILEQFEKWYACPWPRVYVLPTRPKFRVIQL